MRYTTPPQKDKRLLKMLKHFFHNTEAWWNLARMDGKSLGLVNWNDIQRRLTTISKGALGNWTDEEVEYMVARLDREEYQALREELLALYEHWYRLILEKGIDEALADSEEIGIFLYQKEYDYCGKSLTETGGYLVMADMFVSKEGLPIFLKTTKRTPVTEQFPKEIRTAFFPDKESIHRNRNLTVQFFRDRSYILAKKHGIEL